MKKSFLSLLLISMLCFTSAQAQQLSSYGLQWSNSLVSYNAPFEGINVGTEVSAISFMHIWSVVGLAPELGFRNFRQSYFRGNGDRARNRAQFIHAKLSLLFPFDWSFYQTGEGLFTSVGYAQNMFLGSQSQFFNEATGAWEDILAEPDINWPRFSGDLHLGLGYGFSLNKKLNMTLRLEYARRGIDSNLSQRELSLAVALGRIANNP